jgi:MFS family permease
MDQAATARRLRLVIFVAVALSTTGYIAAVGVSTLAARQITGSPGLTGFPSAAAVVATAVGTSLLGQLLPVRGRRFGLVLGAAVTAAGALVAVAGTTIPSLPLLVVGMGVTGLGYAATHVARYVSADLAPPERRGSALSMVVFAGTVGAVVGPRLLDSAGRLAERLTGTVYAGGFAAAAVFASAAALLYATALHPDPSTLAAGATEPATARGDGDLRSVLARPAVRLGVAALVVGQVVMMLIMTATPIHIEDGGHDLGLVGAVFSAHTLGMFAFAPLAGWLADRLSPKPVIGAGTTVLLVSAFMAALAPEHAVVTLGWALFLLGFGWSLGFVAGSALLTRDVDLDVRPILQGRVDSGVWLASALSSAGAGVLLAGPGYSFLSLLGAALIVVVMVMTATAGQTTQPA